MGRGRSSEGKKEDNVRALGISIITTRTKMHIYRSAVGVCVLLILHSRRRILLINLEVED